MAASTPTSSSSLYSASSSASSSSSSPSSPSFSSSFSVGAGGGGGLGVVRRNGWCVNPLKFKESFSELVSLSLGPSASASVSVSRSGSSSSSLLLSGSAECCCAAEGGSSRNDGGQQLLVSESLSFRYSHFPHDLFYERGGGGGGDGDVGDFVSFSPISRLGSRFSAEALTFYRGGANGTTYFAWLRLKRHLDAVYGFGVPSAVDIFFSTPICVYAFHLPSTFCGYTFPLHCREEAFPGSCICVVPGVDGYFINFFQYTSKPGVCFFLHVRSDLSYSVVLYFRPLASASGLFGCCCPSSSSCSLLRIRTISDYLEHCYHAADCLEEFMLRMVFDYALCCHFVPCRSSLGVRRDLCRVYASNCELALPGVTLSCSVTLLKRLVVGSLSPSVWYSFGSGCGGGGGGVVGGSGGGGGAGGSGQQQQGCGFPIYCGRNGFVSLLRGNTHASLEGRVTIVDPERLPLFFCGVLKVPGAFSGKYNDSSKIQSFVEDLADLYVFGQDGNYILGEGSDCGGAGIPGVGVGGGAGGGHYYGVEEEAGCDGGGVRGRPLSPDLDGAFRSCSRFVGGGAAGVPSALRSVTLAQIAARSQTVHCLFSHARGSAACTTLPVLETVVGLWREFEEHLFVDASCVGAQEALLFSSRGDVSIGSENGGGASVCGGCGAGFVRGRIACAGSRLRCLEGAVSCLGGGLCSFERLRRLVQELEAAVYLQEHSGFVVGGGGGGCGGGGYFSSSSSSSWNLYTIGDYLGFLASSSSSCSLVVDGEVARAAEEEEDYYCYEDEEGGFGNNGGGVGFGFGCAAPPEVARVMSGYLACFESFRAWMEAYDLLFHMVLSFIVREYEVYSRLYNPDLRFRAWTLRRFLLVANVYLAVPRKQRAEQGGGGCTTSVSTTSTTTSATATASFCLFELLDVYLIQLILEMPSLRFLPCDGAVYQSDLFSSSSSR